MRSDVIITKGGNSTLEYLLGVLRIGYDAQVCEINEDQGTIEATVRDSQIHWLNQEKGVGYVRPVFTYHCSTDKDE